MGYIEKGRIVYDEYYIFYLISVPTKQYRTLLNMFLIFIKVALEN